MKKFLIFVFVVLTTTSILSCQKEESKPCNCGVITDDGASANCYWLEIRNDCTQNKKTFCFDYDVWIDNYVGGNFCVTNQGQW